MSKLSFCLLLAIIPALGQPAAPRAWDDLEERRSLWPSPDRFPRADDESARTDSLAPRATPRLGTASGKISAQALRRPPSKKDAKLVNKAQTLSESGDRAQAIEILRAAAPGASAYIHSQLGIEYLKSGRPDLAVPELEEAVRRMPGESAHHSNLAYAYRWTRRLSEGEHEARVALELDHASGQAHFLLGVLLIEQSGDLDEAIVNLKLARGDVRSARLALAQVYAVTGLPEAARRELAAYFAVAPHAEQEIAWKWLAERVGQAILPAAAFPGGPEAGSKAGCGLDCPPHAPRE